MIKQYKKTCDYSYTLGFYPTLELIKRRKDLLRFVYASNQALESDGFRLIEKLVDKSKIIISDNALEKLSDKGNDFVAGVFNKEEQTLDKTKTHVVLVNPSDMGNLGNIMRSMLAFDYNDLAIITPAADMYNPKTVRASMGAMFGNVHHLQILQFQIVLLQLVNMLFHYVNYLQILQFQIVLLKLVMALFHYVHHLQIL